MAPSASPGIAIHATGLLVGGIGVLIRGASGAGKSLLALELLDTPAFAGGAALVGDDHLVLRRTGAGVVMSGPPAWRGRIELRGFGIVERPAAAQAMVGLVVDLVDTLVRLPEPHEFVTELLDAPVERVPVPRRGVADPAHQRLLVGESLRRLRTAGLAKSQEFT